MYIYFARIIGYSIGIFIVVVIPILLCIIAFIGLVQEFTKPDKHSREVRSMSCLRNEKYTHEIYQNELVIVNRRRFVVRYTGYKLKSKIDESIKFGYFIFKGDDESEFLFNLYLRRINLPYDSFVFLNDGYIRVGKKSTKEYGILNNHLKVIIPAEYNECLYAKNHRFLVCYGDTIEIIYEAPDGRVETMNKMKASIKNIIRWEGKTYYEVIILNGKQTAVLFDENLNTIISGNFEVITQWDRGGEDTFMIDGDGNFLARMNGEDVVINIWTKKITRI